ncbi:hypothetical protein KKE06_04545, partial [Candidatus Micrarchaeota archaeon]|nr:hypothetical protein [Candidatus Micrarchaeota archaeon]
LTERETISYEALVGTENNLTAQNALQKEIAYYVLFQYLFEINIKTTYDITETGFDMDETIRLTNQEISIIEAVPLLPSSMLEEFAQDSGLSQEQIQNGIKETLEAFLDFKKNEFQESVTRYEQAVMGHQLLTWQFTLQAIAMQTT